MNTVYPDYYPSFRCIAGACRHSCCIGWEIDIDPEALSKYRSAQGSLGSRLRDSIDFDADTPHFRLTADERCPFLNRQGLCDIILAEGEQALCQICADHPRFRNVLSGCTEIGLGLCCEAAAELILKRAKPVHLIGREDGIPDDEAEIVNLRNDLVSIMQDRSMSVADRVLRIEDECEIVLPRRSASEWADLLLDLECLDPQWHKTLDILKKAPDAAVPGDAIWETASEQLCVYFLYRHVVGAVEDGDTEGRIAFALFSARLILALCGAHLALNGQVSLDDLVEYARQYSSEIEYSDENMDIIMNALFDE